MKVIKEIFYKYIFLPKYYLLYAAIAQITLLAINMLILLSSIFDIPYTVFQSVVPTYIYLIAILFFYFSVNKIYNKGHNVDEAKRRANARTTFSAVLNYTLIVANVVYAVITTFDITGIMYYLDTVIIQTFNAFYLVVYLTIYGRQYAQGIQLKILLGLSYTAAILVLLSFYFCFVNMLAAWALLNATAVLLFCTYLMFYENFKKSLPKKKVLRSRVNMSRND